MTKTKRSFLAYILGILLALAVTIVTAGAAVSAHAADPFAAHTEGGAVYPGGQSEQTVTKALNDKIAALNATIAAAKEAGKDLATAYADGDILVYSQINDGVLNADNKRSGWKIWEGAALLDLKFLNAGYGDWGDQYVGWLMYNGVANEAYIVTAEFANRFARDNGQKLGSAMGDMFRVGDVKYQNFTNGYMKSEGGTVTVVDKKNVTVDGSTVSETDADPTASGFVGAATKATLEKADVSGAQFSQAFIAAYNRYKAEGIDVGYPFSPVMENGKNAGGEDRYGTIYAQNFRWGSSVSDPWNDGGRSRLSFLVYNFEQVRVYLVADEFHYRFEHDADNDVKALGDPIGDAFLAGGNRYQNYEKGYMKAEGETPQNRTAEVVLGKNVDAEGVASDIDVQDKIGALGKTVTDSVLPQGKTAAQLTADFKAAYTEKVEYADDESLVGVDMVAYANGYISQSYTDNNGKKHVLAYIAESDSFVYLRPAVADKTTSSLGKPTASRIEVASVEDQKIYAYPFQNGYVKLTVSQQEKIVGGEPVTVINESAVATEGATFDGEKVFFETTSYSASLTANIVSHTTNGDNASVDDAYWSVWGIQQPSDEAIAAAFKKAYDDAFAMGFSAGTPSPEGILFWKSGNSGVIKITLKGGNGNANFWGDNTIMLYNPETGKVHISTGHLANCYANDGASGNGWPTTDMMLNTATGEIVQQFDITDTDVEHRRIYIIVSDGRASKVSGEYDFDANKNGGEWVNYLSKFGGSISSVPVAAPEIKAGEKVEIDFGTYVQNKDGYKLTWKLTSAQGTLDNGKFALAAMPESDLTVTVEVYSAFDKLTLSTTVKVKSEGGNTQPGDDKPSGDKEKKGCGSAALGGSIGGGLALMALCGVLMIAKKRKTNA